MAQTSHWCTQLTQDGHLQTALVCVHVCVCVHVHAGTDLTLPGHMFTHMCGHTCPADGLDMTCPTSAHRL